MNFEKKSIGARIAHLREAKGLTTNRLANNCGLSQSFLRSVELGEKGITVENLALVCEALGITLKDFFDAPSEQTPIIGAEELKSMIERLNSQQKSALAAFLRTISQQ